MSGQPECQHGHLVTKTTPNPKNTKNTLSYHQNPFGTEMEKGTPHDCYVMENASRCSKREKKQKCYMKQPCVTKRLIETPPIRVTNVNHSKYQVFGAKTTICYNNFRAINCVTTPRKSVSQSAYFRNPKHSFCNTNYGSWQLRPF